MSCAKIPFPSRAEAQRASSRHKGGLKVYRCTHCGFWHLSSKTPQEVKRTRRRLDA